MKENKEIENKRNEIPSMSENELQGLLNENYPADIKALAESRLNVIREEKERVKKQLSEDVDSDIKETLKNETGSKIKKIKFK